MLDKVKAHVGRHKGVYTAGAFVIVSGVSCCVGIRIGSSNLLLDNSATLIGINGKMNHTVNVLVNRSGPASWMVRCVETGEEFISQRAAALAKGIAENEMSMHLNGLTDHAGGLRFVRTGLAA